MLKGAQNRTVPVTQFVTWRGRMTVELSCFETLARNFPYRFPNGGVNGVRISDLPQLWPNAELYQKARGSAELFMQAMKQQGGEPLQPAEGLKLFGPYRHRDFAIGRTTPTATAIAETDVPDCADFIIEGDFLATRGKVPELV